MSLENFKGDVTPTDAWKGLLETVDAVLLDVRTSADLYPIFSGGLAAHVFQGFKQ